jgi:hypothetical protein
MKKLLAIVLLTALIGVSIHTGRSHQLDRSSRAPLPAPATKVLVTKVLNPAPGATVSAAGTRIYEPAAVLLYSQPQSVTTRLVAR